MHRYFKLLTWALLLIFTMLFPKSSSSFRNEGTAIDSYVSGWRLYTYVTLFARSLP